jgi:hypothetical protein
MGLRVMLGKKIMVHIIVRPEDDFSYLCLWGRVKRGI